MERIINVAEHTIFGDSWKPLNTGIVMASLSFMDVSEFLLLNGYKFILGHRMTQDAIENIMSQVRNKTSRLPNAVRCVCEQ